MKVPPEVIEVWTCPECGSWLSFPRDEAIPGGPAICAHPSSRYVTRQALLLPPGGLTETLLDAIGNAAVVHLVEDGPIRLIPDEWRAIEAAAIKLRAALDRAEGPPG